MLAIDYQAIWQGMVLFFINCQSADVQLNIYLTADFLACSHLNQKIIAYAR